MILVAMLLLIALVDLADHSDSHWGHRHQNNPIESKHIMGNLASAMTSESGTYLHFAPRTKTPTSLDPPPAAASP